MKTNSELWNRLLKNENFKEKFNKYNKSIADSLYVSNQQEHNVLGREDEIERLRGIMERPLTPVALLIGQAGTGKTALVQEFAKQSKLHNYVVLSLRLGTLGALDSGSLKNALANILNNLKTLQDEARVVLEDDNFEIILFVDEIHMIVTIFGPGTKIGGDVLKDILTKPPIKVIGATTQREYDSTIATDKPLAERFKQIEIKELPKEIILTICKDWWKKQAKNCPMPSDDIINLILDDLLRENYVPVIAPLASDENGQSYNINADLCAAAVAKAYKADKIIFLTDTRGILDKNGELLSKLDENLINSLKDNGTISGGMIPKTDACLECVRAGVKDAHIIDGRELHSLLLEIFTDGGIGSMVKLNLKEIK